jgi:voltage-gated potassium channel
MTEKTTPTDRHSNSYNMFIFVLTILSLAIMVVMVLPLSEETLRLLGIYDNIICVIFLIDFFSNLIAAPKKSDYFIKERGWLDLLGSIPSFGISRYGGLLRLARLSRLARITRLMGGKNRAAIVKDVLENRGKYAGFITILLTMLVLTVASVLVLQFESVTPDANIHTGWDAFWYSMVTITTVGYGDRYPVTVAGRITGMFIMLMGVGVIGALASILSSVLLGSSSTPEEETPPAPAGPTVEQELADLKERMTVMQSLLEKMSREDDQKETTSHLPGSSS